jgi:protein-disulfide isomerase
MPAARRNRVRRGRRRWVGATVLAAIAISLAIAAGITWAGNDSRDVSRGTTLPTAGEATAVFRGIPQRGLVLGRPRAPVTVVEFVDLQCPYCRQFELEALPRLIDEHVRRGDVRLELRGLAFLGPDSELGLRAVLAASRQNRMFELMELLYHNQGAESSGWLSQDLVEAAARSIRGLDVARMVDDMDSDAVSELLDAHAAEAGRYAVDSTPTVLVGRTGGELARVELSSPSDVAALNRAIAAAAA